MLVLRKEYSVAKLGFKSKFTTAGLNLKEFATIDFFRIGISTEDIFELTVIVPSIYFL